MPVSVQPQKQRAMTPRVAGQTGTRKGRQVARLDGPSSRKKKRPTWERDRPLSLSLRCSCIRASDLRTPRRKVPNNGALGAE